MGNSPFEHVNIKQARRLLRAITDLARESSMTGSLEKGAKTAIRQYNGLLNHLSETGAVPEGLFSGLDEDEDRMDDLGVACTLLGAYIEEDDTIPEAIPAERLPASAAGAFPTNMIVHSDSQELRELRELKELLRERMPNG